MDILEQIRESIIDISPKLSEKLTRDALNSGISAKEILDSALVPGMDEVGQLFREGEYFVPEVLVAAKAMHASLDLLEPLLASGGIEKVGKIIAGTIEGDLHDIGKNLVCMMMNGAGFEVIDLGVDVKPEQFVEAVRKEKPDFVMISALLTSTMVNMPKVLKALEEAGLRDQVQVLIGGAPLTAAYAEEIGADGYSEDSAAAVQLVRSRLKK